MTTNSKEPCRPAPHVIRVPPPDGAVIPPYIMYPLSALFVVAVPIAVPWMSWFAAVALAVGLLSAAGLLAGVTWWSNAQYRRRRREYITQLGEKEPDAWGAAILAEWRSPVGGPKAKTIRAALDKITDPSPGARIVCLGMLDVPEVGDLFFEPEIITPTRSIGRHLFFVPLAAALIMLWLLQKLGVLPDLRVPLSSFSYFLVMGVVISALWVWRGMIRPAYVRLAPGIIQVLEYRYGKDKPTIRGYPLETGTLAVVHGPVVGRKRKPLALTLLRGEHEDRLDLAQMRKPDHVIERTWQALLSTAPTPPLSDEDLVG